MTMASQSADMTSNFLFKVDNLLDKHAPFKEQAKRQEKLRFKPWISKGILASIKRKDKN